MNPLPRSYTPPDFSTEDAKEAIFAIQALHKGKANEGQQKIALNFILNHLCQTYVVSFHPDDKGGERATCFAEGRRYTGLLIEKIIRNGFDALTKK